MARRRKRDPTPFFFLLAAFAVGVLVVGIEVAGFLAADGLEEASRTIEAPGPEGEETGDEESPPAWQRVRVEVLNAAGVAGMAARARSRLLDAGFDVVYYGNAATFDRERSVVVDRVGAPSTAERIARVLGIEEVISDPDPSLLVEASVLLGADWEGEEREGLDGAIPLPGEEERPWWAPPWRIFRDAGR